MKGSTACTLKLQYYILTGPQVYYSLHYTPKIIMGRKLKINTYHWKGKPPTTHAGPGHDDVTDAIVTRLLPLHGKEGGRVDNIRQLLPRPFQPQSQVREGEGVEVVGRVRTCLHQGFIGQL